MNKQTSFLVLGGDARQQYLLALLKSQGFLCQNAINGTALDVSTLSGAIQKADVICGPIPFLAEGQIKGTSLSPKDLLLQLQPDKHLFGGGFSQTLSGELSSCGVHCHDYMKNEELACFNTIATAEGLLADIIISYPDNLYESRVLILGFGRCAVTLADRLHHLGAHTTVCARNEKSLGQAKSLGHETLPFSQLKEEAPHYPLIINTIPALVLDEDLLAALPKSVRLYDIASAPGGIDFAAASRLGLIATLHLGLPGRYAPKASARAMYRYILQSL